MQSHSHSDNQLHSANLRIQNDSQDILSFYIVEMDGGVETEAAETMVVEMAKEVEVEKVEGMEVQRVSRKTRTNCIQSSLDLQSICSLSALL